MDSDNHLFGNKAEAEIFIVPPVFEGSFLERLEFIVAPGFISDIFIKGYYRSGNNLFGKQVQNSFRRTVDITIDVHETDRRLVFLDKTG